LFLVNLTSSPIACFGSYNFVMSIPDSFIIGSKEFLVFLLTLLRTI